MAYKSHLTDGVGLWCDCSHVDGKPGRPTLFLDRDGVVVEEVDFLSRPQDTKLSVGVGRAIAEANKAGVLVVVVTNQSGIAREHFGWKEFAAVQTEIVSQLKLEGAYLDAVLACGYYGGGEYPYNIADHAWRKPAPGMLQHVHQLLKADLPRSFIIGDRISDLEAGVNAGLAGGALVMTGYGRDHKQDVARRKSAWLRGGFMTHFAEQPAEAISLMLRSIVR